MRALFTIPCLAAALALSGCAATTDHEVDSETIDQASEALDAYGQRLVGAWKIQSGESFDFDELVLKEDGTFFTHRHIVCIKAPCPTGDSGKWRANKPAKGSVQGRLRLITKTEVTQYEVVEGGDGTIKLSRCGSTAKFDAIGTYCQSVEQCEGQADTIQILCIAGYHSEPVCTEKNTCSKTCVKDEAPACQKATQGGPSSCKPDTLWKDYASSDCQSRGLELGALTTRVSCGVGTSRYVDYQCCPATAPAPCTKTGCSGEICSDKDVVSICIFRPDYACYAGAICERDEAGACAWAKTPALEACLASGGACTYAEPGKRYVGFSSSQCSLIRYACDFAAGETYFSDACGCGCLTK